MKYGICLVMFVVVLLGGIELDKKNYFKHIEKRVYRNLLWIFSLLTLWPLANYAFWYCMFLLIAALGVYFIPIYRKQKEKEQDLRKLKYEFPIWLRQIQVLLQNNNVQHSLEKSLSTAPAIMQSELEELIRELKLDATNSNAYLDFMKEYEIYEISRAMKLLYRYHMVGAEESYHQFQRMLEATGKWLRAERKNRNESLILTLNWIGIIPLLGCTAMFVSMMILIIMNMMKGGLV